MSAQIEAAAEAPRAFAQSRSTKTIAAALARAQAAFGSLRPTGEAQVEDEGGRSYRYATLAAILQTVVPALAEHGIAVVQAPAFNGSFVAVTTELVHSSGQWFRSTLHLQPRRGDPQSVGSAITYGRRYGLLAMVGLAPDEAEDDDGAAASGRQAARRPAPAEIPSPDPERSGVIAAAKFRNARCVVAFAQAKAWYDERRDSMSDVDRSAAEDAMREAQLRLSADEAAKHPRDRRAD